MTGIREMRPTLWVGLLLFALLIKIQEAECRGFQGIPGNFCRNRQPSECCDDRLDTCEVPIRGTYCYCDEFCFTGDHIENDCCPDFFEVCYGRRKNVTQEPPVPPIIPVPKQPLLPLYYNDPPQPEADCEKDGHRIPSKHAMMFNCNECRCQNGVLNCDHDECMVNKDLISTINRTPLRTYGWRAVAYNAFWGRKVVDGLRMRTGTFSPEDNSQEIIPIRLDPDMSKIPRTFDARKLSGKGRVGEVCDQGWCGASWVFSTLGVAQDRLAIVAQGHERVKLSAQNLLSCAELGQQGCQGGHIDRAWNYLRFFGVVKEECYDYVSGKSSQVTQCIIKRNDLSQLTCQFHDRFKMEPAYRISNKVEDIQWEIFNNGPVQALMTVYSDLFAYRSGIYRYTGITKTDLPILDSATHSVRIMGWGEERMHGSSETLKYWLVANSWGSSWGEQGYFRIRRGTNECDIESFIIASRVKLANIMYGTRKH